MSGTAAERVTTRIHSPGWLNRDVRRKLKLVRRRRFEQLHFVAPPTISKLMRLPVRERLGLAEKLWLSVADEQRMVVPDEHKRILRKRMVDYRAGRTKAIPHDELMRRLRAS